MQLLEKINTLNRDTQMFKSILSEMEKLTGGKKKDKKKNTFSC
jgi:hypothetical protein